MAGKTRKLMIVLRLYSGLVESMSTGRWSPAGTPAIFKLIDRLRETGMKIELVLYQPERRTALPAQRHVDLKGLDLAIRLLGPGRLSHLVPDRFYSAFLQIWLVFWSIWHVGRNHVDIFYTDRYNILSAGAVARFTRARTVVRMLGVPSVMMMHLTGRRLMSAMIRWAYRSPFAAVIGTRDGSVIRQFLDRALAQRTVRHIRLNGIEKIVAGEGMNRPIQVLFLGRLIDGKGADSFIRTAALIRGETGGGKTHFNLIGDGPDRAHIESMIRENGLTDMVTLHGALAHGDVLQRLPAFDLYISFNRYGQLSNANLEAASAGLCLMLPRNRDADDDDAEKVLTGDAICWFDGSAGETDLAVKLMEMIAAPEEILRKKAAARRAAQDFTDWKSRIDWELDLLRNLG